MCPEGFKEEACEESLPAGPAGRGARRRQAGPRQERVGMCGKPCCCAQGWRGLGRLDSGLLGGPVPAPAGTWGTHTWLDRDVFGLALQACKDASMPHSAGGGRRVGPGAGEVRGWSRCGRQRASQRGEQGGQGVAAAPPSRPPAGGPAPQSAGRAAGQLHGARAPGPHGPDGDPGRHPAQPGHPGHRRHQHQDGPAPAVTV